MHRSITRRPYRARMTIFALSFLLIAASIISMTSPVRTASADDTYWITLCPAASNSTYRWSYGHYQYTEDEKTEVEVALDGSVDDMYFGLDGVAVRYDTNDFTHNDSWLEFSEWDDDNHTQTGDMPPDNATIENVYVVARLAYYAPDAYLAYSLNNGSDYEQSSLITSPYLGMMPYILMTWDVTELEVWTPQMLNTSDLCARMIALPDADIHYYVDYVGFYFTWYADIPGGGQGGLIGEDDDIPEGDFDFGNFFLTENIVGVMGTVGMIGMILTPTATILIYRMGGHEAVPLFVKMLTLFMFCCTLTLYSLS